MKTGFLILLACIVPLAAVSENSFGFSSPTEPLSNRGGTEQVIGDTKSPHQNAPEKHDSSKLLSEASPSLPAAPEGDAVRLIKIRSIGAILNGVDEQHLFANLKTLVEVADTYDLDVGDVVTIGGLNALHQSPLSLHVAMRGGKVAPRGKPPEGYDVKRSPTWVLNTEEGEVLLEGITDLKRYISSKGEFVVQKEW